MRAFNIIHLCAFNGDNPSFKMEWTNELLEAVHLGKVGEIKRLLCTGSDPNSRGFIQAPVRGACSVSRSALHVAAIQSHYECIVELIRSGARINVQDEDGYTPAHYLCQKYVTSDEEGERISKCLKVLFKFGASTRIRTFTGKLNLHDLALRSKNWFCAKIVEEEGIMIV